MKRRALVIAICEYEKDEDTEYCQSNAFNAFEMHRLLYSHNYDITTNNMADFKILNLDKDLPKMSVEKL